MNVLVYGAGVLGSFYGAKLARAGHDVTMLARGARAEQLRADGVVVDERGRGRIVQAVRVIERLAPDEPFDYVIVLVRNDQVASVLPALAESRATPTVVFMFNNAEGPGALVEALGKERVVLGFPGAGGERSADGVVTATVVLPFIQKTTLGELDGRSSARVRTLARALEGAGFPSAISPNIDAWLKTHVALVSPIADAFYDAGEDMQRLAADTDRVARMVRRIRQAFAALEVQGIRITPPKLRSLRWLPEGVIVAAARRALRTAYAELIVARHARVARVEMAVLREQLEALVGPDPEDRR